MKFNHLFTSIQEVGDRHTLLAGQLHREQAQETTTDRNLQIALAIGVQAADGEAVRRLTHFRLVDL